MNAFVTAIRTGDWLTPDRARAHLRVLGGASFAFVVVWAALSHAGLDLNGRPLGTDFLSFWAASKLTLTGHPNLVYRLHDHALAEQAAFPHAKLQYFAFFYPPIYLIICLPLALLPYLQSLAAWLTVTGLGCWRCVARLLNVGPSEFALLILAFPPVLLDIGAGQNAFLTTALFGAGAMSLDRRPRIAGICFGLLAFKPHLGIVLPIALIAAARWKTILAAGFTVVAYGLLATTLFGTGIWPAFLADAGFTRTVLEQDTGLLPRLQSTFAAVRILHGAAVLAYAAQAVVALAVCVLAVVVVRRRPGGEAEAAVIASATLVASPFLLDYDLMLLAIPLAWTVREGLKRGFLSWEKSALYGVFVFPLFARVSSVDFHLALGPIVLFSMFLVVVRRVIQTKDTGVGLSDGPDIASARLVAGPHSHHWGWSSPL